jgi:hypothetical protein
MVSVWRAAHQINCHYKATQMPHVLTILKIVALLVAFSSLLAMVQYRSRVGSNLLLLNYQQRLNTL